MREVKKRAEQSRDKPAPLGPDLDLQAFRRHGAALGYDADYRSFSPEERQHLLKAGIELTDQEHAGTFFLADASVVHCAVNRPEVEVKPILAALDEYDWLRDQLWSLVPVDADKYTAQTELALDNGYFIRALPGAQVPEPVESALYLHTDRFSQHIHNVVIVEPEAHLHIITGCTAHPKVHSGLHIGVSEFFVRKGGRLTFTMIHNWAEDIHVRPRTGVRVEEGGQFISNYILLKPVKTVQMYPSVSLAGEGAVARLQSIIIAHPGSELDVGGRVILQAPHTRAEVIARSLTLGGNSIARGHLVGLAPEVKAHLECRGLILSEKGRMYAVPELEARVAGVDMSHEAAVGRIAQEEIEYLMARGLDEDEAVSTIVRGFLSVKIEGLPPALDEELEAAIQKSSKGM